MQFNASRRGAIIASLMQYLSSFRRLVSAERAVDKSLPPPTAPRLLVPLIQHTVLAPAARYVEAISPGRNYIPQIVILSGTALKQHSHYFPLPPTLVPPPPPPPLTPRMREFLFPSLLAQSRG